MKDQVGSGSYYGGGTIETISSSRSVRGPMDRFMVNNGDDEGIGTKKMTPATAKEHRNRVCLDIRRCIFENGISFNVTRSPSWINMCHSIREFDRGLKQPSMYEMRTWILDKEMKTTTTVVNEIRDTSIDASDYVKDATKLFELIDDIIEEVREDIFVQVVTDNASAYKVVRHMLMEKRKKLYWTPWSPNVSDHPGIKQCLLNCMEMILGDNDLYMKVDAQIKDFKNKKGKFGSKSALASYSTDPPLVWCDYIGDEVPELKLFAIKILELTCSLLACKRNWSTLNQVHTKRRNHLSTTRLNKLVYIMYNKKLKHKFLKKQSRKMEDDPLIIEEVPSDDEWLANSNDEEDMAIDIADMTFEMIEGQKETSNKKRKSNLISFHT
ncbi:hypothetical protein C2S52_010471 [Perilla frutescens var. hirtella]|nr:hypothetical protein C2S52_010471 [Perilla frutescens var. hirtella]